MLNLFYISFHRFQTRWKNILMKSENWCKNQTIHNNLLSTLVRLKASNFRSTQLIHTFVGHSPSSVMFFFCLFCFICENRMLKLIYDDARQSGPIKNRIQYLVFSSFHTLRMCVVERVYARVQATIDIWWSYGSFSIIFDSKSVARSSSFESIPFSFSFNKVLLSSSIDPLMRWH